MHGANSVGLAFAEHVQRDPGRPAVVGEQQVEGQGVLDDLELSTGTSLREGGQQRTRDLRAGRVTAGVRDPASQVTAFPGERERSGRLPVKLSAQRDQPAHRTWPVGDQRTDSLLVADARARGERV